ncbi:MAG: aconitate hydratase [Dehalococcoidia bacterium]|nr:aconitate hydratase [Dehalococcoidia bacterium]
MPAPLVESSPAFVEEAYRKIDQRLRAVRERLGRPLTYAEKVFLGHLDDPDGAELEPGRSYVQVRPDRVALQDVTGQMAILQFMQAGRPTAAVPTTVHCDHLIQARVGAASDTSEAVVENKEVYDFLRSASNKFGLGFWGPGSGIIHQVVLENYAFPGALIIGTDSHTPNAGGLGTFASGVGGADAVDVMAGFPWEVLYPRLIGVKLTGALSGWTAPKDVILKLAGILTVKGGTNAVVEYFGPGLASISATGRATITNMGAEIGATTSIFPFDERAATYLRATERADLADLAQRYAHLLACDPEVEEAPERFFDRVIEIDLSALEPHVVGPHTPDLARPISEMAAAVASEGYPDRVSAALIGSCTNSSYEDISRVAAVARQAEAHGVKVATPLLVTPGSEAVHATIRRDGQMRDLEEAGATVLANACGPCIGQWRRPTVVKGEANAIVSSFNRNFPARNDGNAATMNFIASPEIVLAFALAGRLSFNPLTDALGENGGAWKLDPPGDAPDVPPGGYAGRGYGYQAPAEDGGGITVEVDPASNRLQLLEPFAPWDGQDFERLPVLVKAQGKCTTDHISPAGPWLRFRGHLDNISDNAFLGAVNAYTGEPGQGLNVETGERGVAFPAIARDYKARGLSWVAVGDENYGEGSSREHAAMSPRLLGARAVIVRSFARIHESNLKKQGILPFTFDDPSDYDKVRETDRVSVHGLVDLAPGASVRATLHHDDGSADAITLRHTMSAEHIAWFQAGAALNILGQGAG